MSEVVASRSLDVVSSGVRLHAEVWGERGPTLLLAHGFGGSARNFRPQARHFADQHRIVLFDARGHARSEAPSEPGAYEPERFVADLGAVLDRAGAERAIIGGLSMGAGTALRFALDHPERTGGLVLASFPRAAAAPGHVEWATGFARAIRQEGLEAAGREFVWGALSRLDPKAADLVRAGFLEHTPLALAETLERSIAVQPSPAELAPALAKLCVPALIVAGSEDAGSLEPSRELARLIPGAELVEIPGGGHVVNLTSPVAFNRALGDFLAQLA